MEKQFGRKLGSLFGLMVFGFALFLGFYHFSRRFASEYSVHNVMKQKAHPDTFYKEVLPSDAARGRYVLHLNQSQTIGKANLIYRGLAGESTCRIDVIIPELDPDRPYRHDLDIKTAKRGFRIAGTTFKLDAWKANYIRIVRTSAGNE